ncbi:hypothetical protein [Enterococcus faecium]|uniref:hypothetical protein n=1 Tax=Enterococcus faecium TaxID=1352 RepID=UPI0008138F4C|nr:hypothetical protein [Enterococcus faecium]EGP5215737.1 hypothetical protein [Enterococcus faecium]
MFFTHPGLTRRQVKEICIKFQCSQNEFVARRFEDVFLVSLRNKEYRVKFSPGRFSQIVFVKKVIRVTSNRKQGRR